MKDHHHGDWTTYEGEALKHPIQRSFHSYEVYYHVGVAQHTSCADLAVTDH
jgi:hypothetical protein